MYELGDSALNPSASPRHYSAADSFDAVSTPYVEPPVELDLYFRFSGVIQDTLRSDSYKVNDDIDTQKDLVIQDSTEKDGKHEHIRDIPSRKTPLPEDVIETFALGQIHLAEVIAERCADGREPEWFIGNPDRARDAISKAGLIRALEILKQRKEEARLREQTALGATAIDSV